MARLDPLTEFLEQYDGDSIFLTFDEIESLSGARLPRSARKTGSTFWANGSRNVYARHWLAAGFEAGFDECGENEVHFARRHDEPSGDDRLDDLPIDERPAPPAPPDPVATLPPPPKPVSSLPPPPTEVTIAANAARSARQLSDAFTLAHADLLERRSAPKPGWDALPDVELATRQRATGIDEVWIRMLLSFGALLDRGRHRPAVWLAIGALFERQPDAFEPAAVARRSLGELAAVLRDASLTDRLTDVAAWRLLAEALTDGTAIPTLTSIIHAGTGDAAALRAELVDAAPIPQLATPRAFARLLRTLVHPGGATISGIAEIPVVVDADVRRATELLGLTTTARLSIGEARPVIEALWAEAVRTSPPAGPAGLTGTPLALDQALWYHGRVGCLWCRSHTRVEPIGPACESCVLKARR